MQRSRSRKKEREARAVREAGTPYVRPVLAPRAAPEGFGGELMSDAAMCVCGHPQASHPDADISDHGNEVWCCIVDDCPCGDFERD